LLPRPTQMAVPKEIDAHSSWVVHRKISGLAGINRFNSILETKH
jgi:hypothetical protein